MALYTLFTIIIISMALGAFLYRQATIYRQRQEATKIDMEKVLKIEFIQMADVWWAMVTIGSELRKFYLKKDKEGAVKELWWFESPSGISLSNEEDLHHTLCRQFYDYQYQLSTLSVLTDVRYCELHVDVSVVAYKESNRDLIQCQKKFDVILESQPSFQAVMAVLNQRMFAIDRELNSTFIVKKQENTANAGNQK